jgi:peroxiredoxin
MYLVRILTLFLIELLVLAPVYAQQSAPDSAQHQELIPQHLLSIIHAPEVHKELQLTKAQVSDLEALFDEIDGIWFPSRLLPPDQRRPVVAQLEQQVQQWFANNTSAKQQQRLRQLEFQAQSVRMLLRDEMSQPLQLDATQKTRFFELAKKTDEAKRKLQLATKQNKATKQLSDVALQAAKSERDALKSVLKPEQHQKLWELLGKPFNTSKLNRIYPMAPEFVAVKKWINSAPLSMKELRGKVVLVHFYAFQCHNCHANFDIYRRWHDQLRDEGVVVVGIQTPETSREHDPAAVEAAAVERDLQFPILVDLESKNWKAWGNTMWPTIYVVDKNGYIRHWWQGELNWKGATGDKAIEQTIEAALAEKSPAY